ncbi:hypothetical protein SERLA73DRAFT_153254 [Serpula lacrymans var. lacrymans S7.3]|uniref:CCHC-type domain-containing protein n=1 Tax=Serpula lacrymans var. lacrymans (strain S7.3) TaxID=936435 RepID=F8Q184_SERL3|nr:hypothetical protein SERLA73DRAFT_153254 [Serpula lacrymans var. lacrymans S7.3]
MAKAKNKLSDKNDKKLKKNIRCYKCGGNKHISRNCKKARKEKGQNKNEKSAGKNNDKEKSHQNNHCKMAAKASAEDDSDNDMYTFKVSTSLNIIKEKHILCPAIIDSGASQHFSPFRNMFVTFTQITPEPILTTG